MSQKQKLESALTKLESGSNVQNRQLRTLLGEEGYARFLDEWREQLELRETLAQKPKVVVEYERRLKEATFAYAKADAASGQGRHKAAKKLMAVSDAKFERLLEFLEENFEGHAGLECWLDRSVRFDAGHEPSLCPDAFPVVVTSRSLRNKGGGLLSMKRSKLQVKIDAVERALAEQKDGGTCDAEMLESLAVKAKRLRRLAAD
ncbi:hypothetical protein [Ruegeria arenilitoris]|uniref:hypothetical protein n=1 Tax=Ruegeria arenilitoris TaxID=1173585 RepID=UPI00147B246E|nr:hypothetical protein [Ruegeria arenilitoris]